MLLHHSPRLPARRGLEVLRGLRAESDAGHGDLQVQGILDGLDDQRETDRLLIEIAVHCDAELCKPRSTSVRRGWKGRSAKKARSDRRSRAGMRLSTCRMETRTLALAGPVERAVQSIERTRARLDELGMRPCPPSGYCDSRRASVPPRRTIPSAAGTLLSHSTVSDRPQPERTPRRIR